MPVATEPSSRSHPLELRIPPLVVAVLAGLIAWLAARALPQFDFRFAGSRAIAVGVAIVAVMVSVLGVIAFRRAKTTVNPMAPATAQALVTGGIYRVTRNPMYLGFLLLLAAGAMLLQNFAAWAALPLFVAYLNRFQIEPEERALRGRFGARFEEYRARVGRWV